MWKMFLPIFTPVIIQNGAIKRPIVKNNSTYIIILLFLNSFPKSTNLSLLVEL